jgi:hypothetical protein
MSKTKFDINEILLEAHKRGQERAIDVSIRSGVPLVVSIHGKIVTIKPKYKYVLVPIEANEKKTRPHSKS